MTFLVRIQIRGTVQLTYGSEFGSDTDLVPNMDLHFASVVDL